ncbi:hypothetical protein LCGC14_0900860, partial [marine sediment metagenome]
FKCVCGTPFTTQINRVKIGHTKSCGCKKKQFCSSASIQHGDTRIGKKYYLYNVWSGMRERCFNIKLKCYNNYGGRGINVYKEWLKDYVAFKDYILNNIGERPEGYSLDRIDNDGNYEPGNLRWASRSDQQYNRGICKN